DLVARIHALGSENVTALAVRILHQRDVTGAVGIVLEALHDAGDAVLVALEVDDAVLLPRAAAMVARGDAPGVVARAGVALRAGQRQEGPALVKVRAIDLDDRARAGRCGLVLDERHDEYSRSASRPGLVIDRLALREAHISLLPVLRSTRVLAEAARLAGLVDHLNARDLDFEHQLHGLPDVGLGGIAADPEGVLVVILHRQRRLLRHMRGDEHAHQLLAVHCRRSSSIFTAP